MPVLLGTLFHKIRKQLSPVSQELAERDTEQICEQVLRLSRSDLYTNFSLPIDDLQIEEIKALTNKRVTGIPLPYVLGNAFFYSKNFIVTPDVLIPRPDTEIIIETILKKELPESKTFIDIGTGSGIIAEVLTDNRPNWQAIAIDISIPALKIAKKNCSDRVQLLGCDKLSAIKSDTQVNFIVGNPPYISQHEMDNLDFSVKEYEPVVGLYGGKDGLDFYRYLANQGKYYIKNKSCLYCEIGATQHASVIKIFEEAGWHTIAINNDLANRPRVITAQNSVSSGK